MTYALWDAETRNIVAAFPREADALAAVRRGIEGYGNAYADDLVLIREDVRGRSHQIAHGAALADRALAAALPRNERASA
jgi:hypothetical protein